MAREFNIDLSQVRGTGAGGRITKQDVETYMSTSGRPHVFGSARCSAAALHTTADRRKPHLPPPTPAHLRRRLRLLRRRYTLAPAPLPPRPAASGSIGFRSSRGPFPKPPKPVSSP